MASVQVILKEKIDKLGAEADVVTVKPGFATNYLIPTGKALEANKKNMRFQESLKAIRAQREAQELADAEKIAARIKRLRLNMELATGQGGKAFGSITTKDVVEAVKESTGLELDRHALKLDKPIKSTGKFNIPVRLHSDVQVDIRLNVETKGGEEEENTGDAE